MYTLSFIAGVIVGGSLTYAALLLAFRLIPTVESEARKTRYEVRQAEGVGAFIEPPSQKSEAIDEIFRRNEEDGRDTEINDLL